MEQKIHEIAVKEIKREMKEHEARMHKLEGISKRSINCVNDTNSLIEIKEFLNFERQLTDELNQSLAIIE